MEKFLAALLVASFLLLSGCAGNKNDATANASEGEGYYSASFAVPESPIEYTGHYIIDEGGSQVEKTVWRSKNSMRMAIGAGGGGIDLFFVSKKAYSCANTGAGWNCFDITGAIGSQKASELFLSPDMGSAEDAGEVDIGSTKGNCYLFPYRLYEKRKMCFTGRGVVAFDQYNVTNGKTHTEYLTDLAYSVDASDFVLPATPQAAPAAPEN